MTMPNSQAGVFLCEKNNHLLGVAIVNRSGDVVGALLKEGLDVEDSLKESWTFETGIRQRDEETDSPDPYDNMLDGLIKAYGRHGTNLRKVDVKDFPKGRADVFHLN